MARYYFDIRDEDGTTPDDEGLELRNLQLVQDEAARSLADMARDAVRMNASNQSMAIQVRDDEGPVMNVRFSFEIERTD
jgi:hypothetical protein